MKASGVTTRYDGCRCGKKKDVSAKCDHFIDQLILSTLTYAHTREASMGCRGIGRWAGGIRLGARSLDILPPSGLAMALDPRLAIARARANWDDSGGCRGLGTHTLRTDLADPTLDL